MTDPEQTYYEVTVGQCGSCGHCFIEEVDFEYYHTIDGTKMAIPDNREPPAMMCVIDGKIGSCRRGTDCPDYIGAPPFVGDSGEDDEIQEDE